MFDDMIREERDDIKHNKERAGRQLRGAKAIKTPSNYISHGLAKLHAGNSARVQPVPSDIGGDDDEIIET